MKKTIAVVLLLVLALSLCACGRRAEASAAPEEKAESSSSLLSLFKRDKKDTADAAAPAEPTPEPTPDTASQAAEAVALYSSGDYAGAFSKAAELADSGDPAACAIVGRAYYLGLGTKVNRSRALPYLETAAKGGYPSAAYLLAEAVDQGYGIRMDKDEAARRYIKFVAVADEADPAAFDYGAVMCSLSACFAGGRGVEKNHELALDAAKKAADCDNLSPFELMSLADFFNAAAPNHVSKAADAAGTYAVETARKVDAAKAEELYARALPGLRRLADEDNLDATKLLGDLYLDGRGGMTQDYAKALDIYLIAAEEGHAPAQAQVGYIYQNALGVAADYGKAMEWNNRAAQQGNAQGQAQIGYLYQNGLGVTQNLDEAGRWYTRAVEGGSEWAASKMAEIENTNPHASFEAHA